MMARPALLALACLALVACSSPEEEQVDLMNEAADVLEGIKDKESAKAAVERLKEIGEEIQELSKQVKESEIPEELKKEAQAAAERIGKAMQNVLRKYPEVMQALREIDLRRP